VGVKRLSAADISDMRALNALFANAFKDPEHYANNPPDDAWLIQQLSNPQTIVLVAKEEGTVIGGLVAYALPKLEQARLEIYIYDIAIARASAAWVMYVQADYGDDPAIALYTKLGQREDVMHFDIALE
jgi:aminoglycoside 3-N-acetyltransferase I